MKCLIAMFVVSLALVGCGKKSENNKKGAERENSSLAYPEKNENENVRFTVERAVEMNEDFSNEKEFISGLNTFVVQARLDYLRSPSAKLACMDLGKLDNNYEYISSLDEETLQANLIIKLAEDSSNIRNFNCKVIGENYEIIGEQKIQLRKDYLVGKGFQSAKSFGLVEGTSNIGALVLYHSTFVTEGMNINLKAKEFIALGNASIDTFKESDPVSGDDEIGKSGGVINITAERSLGKVTVNMRGKHGGRSTSVDKSYKEFGISDIKDCPVYDSVFTYTTNPMNIMGSRNRSKKVSIPQGFINYEFNGDAAKGPAGGDSGSFYLHSETSNMEVEIVKSPGRGGNGGLNYNPSSTLKVRFLQPRVKRWDSRALNYYKRYGTFHPQCKAMVKIPSKQNVLASPKQGEYGEPGKKLMSCVFVQESNDNLCF